MMNPLSLSYADYEYAPAFDGWHAFVQGDKHPMLTPQILLHKPLRLTSTAHTAAQARNARRSCVWWQEWHESPLKDIYYGFHTERKDEVYLLVFVQPEPGHQQPLRVAVCQVGEDFPQVGHLWLLVGDYLATLPALATTQTA